MTPTSNHSMVDNTCSTPSHCNRSRCAKASSFLALRGDCIHRKCMFILPPTQMSAILHMYLQVTSSPTTHAEPKSGQSGFLPPLTPSSVG
eukprot:1157822-Pelagomonas_calceolata.AAC.13